jgi:hypothetical protein
MQARNYFRICFAGITSSFMLSASMAATPAWHLDGISDDLYPITSWEPMAVTTNSFGADRNGLASLQDCGFTIGAFIRPEHISLCEQLHMPALLADGFPEAQSKWARLSDEQIEARVRRIIGNTAANPTVVGYFLEDEPVASEFSALGKAVQAVKKLAPGKLAYINLFPDYAIVGARDISQLEAATYGEYLQKYLATVKPQFVSYDNYQIQYSMDQAATATAASYYHNLLEVRKYAMESQVPFWNIVASSQITTQFPPPSAANLQLHAYTSLAAGAQGLSWYTYYSQGYQYSAVDTSGTRAATWPLLKMVNDQVKTLGKVLRPRKSTGVYFTAPLPYDGAPGLPGRYIESISADAPLMIGEFDGGDGSSFAMVVNLELRHSAKLLIRPRKPGGILRQLSSMDTIEQQLPPEGALWLTAGQGVLLHIH